MFLLTHPNPAIIQSFVESSAHHALSYEPIGIARPGNRSPFRIDEHRVVLGRGLDVFARAKRALQEWRHFQVGWVELHPAAAATSVGTVVAVVIRHLGFWSMNGCRVVYRHEDDYELTFAYGALSSHAEAGEELFCVSMDPATGEVTYTIRAASRPRAWLAKAGYPVTRALQARFRRDSARAMQIHTNRGRAAGV